MCQWKISLHDVYKVKSIKVLTEFYWYVF
uniref:Uncharacterized protein n=1 Tax=Rhizophora mucronata TaxID=61149 RepID=A0A2P2P754_RHIMU